MSFSVEAAMRNGLDSRLAVLFIATFIYTASSKYSNVHEHDWTHLYCSYDESVEVERANYIYGRDNGDYTRRVREYCCAKSSCSFQVENGFLGGDPSKGNEKDLTVYYHCKRLPHCNKKVCTSGTAKCSSCYEKLLYKVDNGQCIDTCSWTNRLCWPGSCNNGYAKDCHCDKDFSLRSRSSETSCQPTKKPTLLTCQMTVHGDGGEMQYSPTIGTTECKNQQDFYGRFQIKSLTIKMVSEYEVSPTSKKPNFVASYTFGVTEAIVSVQRRNLTDPTPRKITHKELKHDGDNNPQRLLEKNASLTLTDTLSDGDRICIDFEVKGGGYVVAQNLITKSTANYQYSRPSSNKEICFYFDITAPVHCSQTKECNEEPLSLSERILDSLQITASTSTWKDPFPKGGSSKHASGISYLDITVNEMILKGEILSRGKNVMSMKLNSTATFELPESKTPVLYEILLEVKDVADNVRKTRRFALFDNSSNIELDQNSPLRATSASSQTKFIWQTNLKMVCFSWNGRYVNKLHVNGQFLTRIESDEDISKHYEQTTGLLPVNGTRNINGITSYNFTLHRNSAVVKEGVVHNFTSETVCINTKISDGDNLTFELIASDIVSHAITEST